MGAFEGIFRPNKGLKILCGMLGGLLVFLVRLVLVFPGNEQNEPKLPPPPANPYTPADFYYQGQLLYCSAGNAVPGVDVSDHQGSIDWQQVKASGIEFAFIRLGYRGYESGKLNADERFLENIRNARAAGLKVGTYFFSQAVSVEEAEAEAQFAMELLAGETLDLPLCYDWEYVSETARTAGVDRTLLTACTAAFCQKVEAGGYAPMVYFNRSQALDMLHLEQLTSYDFWLAMYDVTMDFPYRVDFWQYSNQAAVPGIPGKADLNLMFIYDTEE